MKSVLALAALAAAVACGPVFAQSETAAEPALAPSPAEGRVAAGSIIEIQLAQTVSSKLNKQGDKFPIRLAAPIRAEGGVLVPAGAEGVGEVVSANRAGAFSKAGELVLAARYIEHDGQRIPLKAFKLSATGKTSSNTIAVAALLAPLPIAIGLMAVPGGDIELPLGTLANAKLAADVALPFLPPSPLSQPPAADPAPATDQPARETQ